MEEKTGKFLIGQQNNSGQVSYSYDDNRKEGPGSVSKMFSQDPSNSMDKILRPGEVNITVGARPVLNYSIQTGEEFALEFMWERVNPRQQHYIPNSSLGANSETTSGDLHGVFRASHAGSERHLDTSLFPSVEKGKIQDAVNDDSQIEEKSIREPFQSIIRASSNNKSVHRLHSHSSLGSCGGPSKLLKLLCSFGGKILPRPSDRKLRYVGGETRILRISKDISWDELKQKTSAIYNGPHSIKYQLPGEDLDALVSVSSDEDLQNMMEEYNVLDDGGSQKLRMFLISNDDLDDSQLGLEALEGDSDIQYVVAVNGMDFGSRRNSIGLDSHLGNNLDELLGLNVERRSGQIAASLPSGGTAHREVASTLPNQSSQIEIPSSSRAFEANSLGYQVQTISEQPEWHSSRASNQVDILPTKDEKIIVPSSVRFQYDYGSHHPLNHRPVAEKLVSNPILGQMVPHENVDQSYGSLNAKVPGVSGLELKLESKTVVQKKIESHKDHSPRRDNESSIRKACDSTKLQPLDDGKAISSHPYDVSSLNNTKLEASAISATTDKGTLVLPKRVSEKNHEDVRDHVPPNIAQDEKMNKLDIVDHAYTSGAATMPLHSDSDVYTEDISYETDIIPQRLFCSERVHREQAGLSRLSKSNNSSGPKLLMTHSRSDVSQHISESVDTLTDWDMTANLEKFNAAKSIYVGSGDTEEKLKESQKLTDDAAVISAMASSVCDKNEPSHKAELDAVVAPIAVTSGSSFPMKNQGTSEYPHSESARTSMEFNHNKMNEKANEAKFMGRGEIPFAAAFQSKPRVVAASPEHGDILIDINDRFPHDFLSDIFSKAIIEESSAGVTPLHGDAAGLSVNLSNHEPKDWSFFQNFAQDDSRRDVSLMDQDHLTFSPSQAKFGEDVPIDYGYPPFEADAVTAVHAHSRTNLDAEIQRPLSPPVRHDTMHLHSDYDISQNVQNLQFDRPMNSRTAVPDYEDAKKAAQPTGFPLVDFSVGEFDPSALQIIKNRDLEELRELGSGTYGTVYHGKWRGSDVAIKRIKKSCFIGRSSEQERLSAEFWHEAGILSKLHHPNVVAFYGVVQDGPGGTLATVTEYMVNGSLRHALISKDRHLDRRKRLIIAMDAAFGMEYLHSRNIVHFDLKCDNLLVNLKDPSRPICKVGDFGLSKIKRNTLVTGGVRGTLPWMAPELLNGSSSKVSEKVDVFSFGIVLWEILTGEEPYANMHYGAIIGGIVNNTLRPPVPTTCDPEWRLLMEQCWAPDPLARPSFTEIAGRLRTMSAACSTKPQGFTAQNQLSK
ncbi:UNVERIFIED_CONTAM: Serine/threonine-protein kinase CTR1 [Sesamum calycinum]|uniref:Serine/threonine-protein kinase CTR1 n=1 Tax=Sesamum calycinum TaxID=2727403 RepID=A0AAW2Q7Z0_9LAMI